MNLRGIYDAEGNVLPLRSKDQAMNETAARRALISVIQGLSTLCMLRRRDLLKQAFDHARRACDSQ